MATAKATAATNGNAASQNGSVPALSLESLPVNTLGAAREYLRAPFTPQAVKFKVQATWQGGGLVVPYIDARLVIERLNLAVPDDWEDDYRPTESGLMWCFLTVCGKTRRDVGEEVGNKKGLVSDALKRAAVKFGIGVSLYAMPKLRLQESDGHLSAVRTTRNGDSYKLTPNGETHCRNLYGAWLDTAGRAAFGDPLDHGDAEEPTGDTEADKPESEAAAETSQAEPRGAAQAVRREGQGDGKSPSATAEQRKEIHTLGTGLGLTPPYLKAWLEWNAHTSMTDRVPKVRAGELIELLKGYDDADEALAGLNASLEAGVERAQRIVAKYTQQNGGQG